MGINRFRKTCSSLFPCFCLMAMLTLACGGGGGGDEGSSQSLPTENGPYLLIYAAGPYQITPDLFGVPSKLTYMDGSPFDGIAFASLTGWRLMESSFTRTYTQMTNELAPMRGMEVQRLKHNFIVVNTCKPTDFFNDWSATVLKFQNLAKALKWAGIEGIFFDNEVYAPQISLFNYPTDCDTGNTLAQYEVQARLRGKQIMQAMVSEYPEITVIFAHGPYVSCVETPAGVRAGQSGYTASELMGAFTVGFMEGMGSQARIVDGGEFYNYLTQQHYSDSYTWRKNTIATAASDHALIPDSLRPVWPQLLNISFGSTTIQFPEETGHAATPANLHQSLVNALNRCDRYAWLFPQGTGFDFLTANGVDASWASAVRQARQDVPYR